MPGPGAMLRGAVGAESGATFYRIQVALSNALKVRSTQARWAGLRSGTYLRRTRLAPLEIQTFIRESHFACRQNVNDYGLRPESYTSVLEDLRGQKEGTNKRALRFTQQFKSMLQIHEVGAQL